jgi:hypothetical protein
VGRVAGGSPTDQISNLDEELKEKMEDIAAFNIMICSIGQLMEREKINNIIAERKAITKRIGTQATIVRGEGILEYFHY